MRANLVALMAATSLAACKASGGGGSTGSFTPPPTLTLTAAPSSIINDGSPSTILVSALSSSGGPGAGTVQLTATQGLFVEASAPVETVTLGSDGTGTATYSCDAAADPLCQGTMIISGTWTTSTGAATASTRVIVRAAPDAGPVVSLPDGGSSPYVDAGPIDLTGATLAVFGAGLPALGVTGSMAPPNSGSLQLLAQLSDGSNATGATVTFAEVPDEDLVALSASSAQVDSSGLATITVTAGRNTGTANIKATLGETVVTIQIQIVGSVDAGPSAPQSIAVVSYSPTILGIAGSGINENGVVTFLVSDKSGNPSVGSIVNFTTDPVPLITFAATSGVTDATGSVTVSIASLSVVGVASVVATVAGGVNPTVTQLVPVRGAKPSATFFYFKCDETNLPAYTLTSQLYSVTCNVRLGDRFGNRIGIPTPVNFLTEAGHITASVETTAYDPTNPDAEGTASVIYTTDFADGLGPEDVDPLPNETHHQEKSLGLTLNPRDQLVTIVAYTRGEEAFIDSNNNGMWDPGEIFFDLSDPYVDANDNNQYDPQTEQRVGGATFNPPNGVWDSNTTIWTSTHEVITGLDGPVNVPAPGQDAGVGASTWLGPLPCLGFGKNESFAFYDYDDWLNRPASGTTYSAVLNPAPANSTLTSELFSPTADNLGSIDLQFIQVAPDGGTCDSVRNAMGGACQIWVAFPGFDFGYAGTLSVSDTANPSVFQDGGSSLDTCHGNSAEFGGLVSASAQGAQVDQGFPGVAGQGVTVSADFAGLQAEP